MKDDDKIMKNCTFSIIIPVLRESDKVNALIEHLYNQQTDEDYEIIIVEGSQTRETMSVVQHREVVVLLSEPGRGRQMNAGAAVARGEILIFLHADTQIPVNALNRIGHLLKQKHYVGGAFDLAISSHKLVFKIIAKVASLRSRFTRIPYGDQIIFLRKDYFNKIGGYKEIPLMEDVELMQRIKRQGDKISILTDKVVTSPRRWEKEGIIFCTLRNWIILTLYMIGISPSKLAKYYKSS
ncbi:MAG: TIGR04283 family arsenosugar biosynthesis glycosyltransferase [Thermodesulfobacteriota bacterium]